MLIRIDVNSGKAILPDDLGQLLERLELAEKKNYLYVIDPVIMNNVIVSGDKVYLERRWAKDICRRGGLEKYAFIELQLKLVELQEQIEKGIVECEFYSGVVKLNQAWPKMNRGGKNIKAFIKGIKKPGKESLNRKFCPDDARTYRKNSHVPLCCMCNRNDKLVLIKA